jgi:hypothetical protein
MKNNRLKYTITFTDFSGDIYGKTRRMTVEAIDSEKALNKAYKKFPKMKCPSVSLK